MSRPHRERPGDAPQKSSLPDESLSGWEAYDEMLEGICAAYLGSEDGCALTCGERCAGEDELRRWAEHYDGRARVARALATTAARAAGLASLARQARFIGDWDPEMTDLSTCLSRYYRGTR